MKNKTVDLVNLWHGFEKNNPDGEIVDFCRQVLSESVAQRTDEANEKIPLDGRLARSIGRLSRFAQFYSRRELAELGLKNLDDFTYLQTLSQLNNPKKSALIEENISEFSTGSEIIKRLTRQGLVKEYPDREDGRSKRLALTAEGKKTLARCYARMQALAGMLFTNMAESDKWLAYELLQPLDFLHTTAYRQARTKGMEKIKEALGYTAG